MSEMYIGFRVEIASRNAPHNLEKVIITYNATNSCSIRDLKTNGKIAINNLPGMIMACGDIEKRKLTKSYAMVNFALVTPISNREELERTIQIINVLGDGRLIRERVKTFVDGKSILNKIPQLKILESALLKMEQYMPGLIAGGWYYAPEAIF